mgnify:CR=1 FL=1
MPQSLRLLPRDASFGERRLGGARRRERAKRHVLGTLPLSAAPKLKVLLEKLSDRMQVVSDLIDEVG